MISITGSFNATILMTLILVRFFHPNLSVCFRTNGLRLFSTAENTITTVSLNSDVPSGLIAIYKPKNWSSAGIVAKIKYILQSEQRRITGVKSKIKVRTSLMSAMVC